MNIAADVKIFGAVSVPLDGKQQNTLLHFGDLPELRLRGAVRLNAYSIKIPAI